MLDAQNIAGVANEPTTNSGLKWVKPARTTSQPTDTILFKLMSHEAQKTMLGYIIS